MQNKERKISKYSYSKKKRDQCLMELYKKKRGYMCQFCKKQILKENGHYYIEACHIHPVEKDGNDNKDNILILCPNCHKLFDFGKKENEINTGTFYSVVLNGVPYNANF